jgi:hypothetical protein
MAAVLAQLRTGDRQPLSRFTDKDLAALEQEPIGEAFSCAPFLD